MDTRLIALLFLFVGCSTIPTTQNPARDPAAAPLPTPVIDEFLIRKSEISRFFGTFRVNSYTLTNGLRILVVEDHSSPTFAFQTWYRVGSRNEEPGHTGLAHFFEHMMFKGTKNYRDGEFDHILEEAGVVGENAFTSRDYTAYIQELPADQLELAMKLESDRMVNLVIDKKGFDTEREVVQNERRFRTENSPDGIMDEELFKLAFKKHPYHWPVIGYEKDLREMSEKNAEAFYHQYYSPNHATVVVVGDVKPRQVLALAVQYYGNISIQETPASLIVKEPPQLAPRRKELSLNIQLEKLLIGYHTPNAKSPELPALEVLQSVLAGSKSSRLDQVLVESGIATSVDAGDLDDKDPSLFLISANMQKGKKAALAESIILKELKNLTHKLVSTEELLRAKNKINFSFFEGLGPNYQKAAFLGRYEAVREDFRTGIEHYEKVQKVTAKELRAVAQKYFHPRNRTVIVGFQKRN